MKLKLQMAKNGEHTDRVTIFVKSRRNKKGETDEETTSVLVSMKIKFTILIIMVCLM